MPLLIVGVCLHCFHIVDFHKTFPKLFHKPNQSLRGKKQIRGLQPKPQRRDSPWSYSEINSITWLPCSFSPLDPLEEGFVLGSSPPPAWTQVPWHCVWHQGSDTVSASITLCNSPQSSSPQSKLLCFLKKEKKKKDILSGHFVKMYHSPDQLTVRVLCIYSTAQFFFFFFFYFFKTRFCLVWNMEKSLLQI